jgi:hypothetical protein
MRSILQRTPPHVFAFGLYLLLAAFAYVAWRNGF